MIRRPFGHGRSQVQSLVGIVDVNEGHPGLEIAKGVDRRISQDRTPQQQVEIWRDPLDLPVAQAAAVFAGLPVPRAPEKTSANCSCNTKVATGTMSPRRPVKSPSRST